MPGYLTACPLDIRRLYIENKCKVMNLTKDVKFPRGANLYIDHPHKLAYCLIPKAASRTFRSILGSLLTQNVSYIPKHDFNTVPGISRFSFMPPKLQQEVLRTYKKMIVVRHPYDRVVSVFDSKLNPTRRGMIKGVLGDNLQQINRYLSEVQGKNVSYDLDKDDLTFDEFVGILSTQYNDGFQDVHWETMFEHCEPCSIKYDFVLRLETLQKDYRVLATYLRTPSALRGSAPFLDQMKSSLLEPEEKMFNLLLRYENLDKKILNGLRRIYARDLEVFGYTWDDEKGKLSYTGWRGYELLLAGIEDRHRRSD